MNKLELYLDRYPNISKSIYNKYETFGYDNEDIYIDDLEFLLNNIYPDIKVYDEKEIKLCYTDFKNELITKFQKCIISNSNCLLEIDACEIMTHSKEEYLLNNGLLLKKNLCATFNKHLWSINPNTLRINIKHNNVGEIEYYDDTQVEIFIDNELYLNLLEHYNIFLSSTAQ